MRPPPFLSAAACLAYVRTLGVPLYNFRVTSVPAAKRGQGGQSPAQQQPSPAAPRASQLPAARPTPASPAGLSRGPPAPAAAAAEAGPGSTTPAAVAAAVAAGASSAAGSLAQQARQQHTEAGAGPAPARLEGAAGPPQQSQRPQREPQRQLGAAGTAAAAAAAGPALQLQLQLQYVAVDPLLQVGGLARVSENGRVWGLRQRAQAQAHQQAQHGQHGAQAQGAQAEGAGEGDDGELWSGSELGRWGFAAGTGTRARNCDPGWRSRSLSAHAFLHVSCDVVDGGFNCLQRGAGVTFLQLTFSSWGVIQSCRACSEVEEEFEDVELGIPRLPIYSRSRLTCNLAHFTCLQRGGGGV